MKDVTTDTQSEGGPALPGALITFAEWKQPAGSVQGTLKDAVRNAWRVVKDGLRPHEEHLDEVCDTASLSERQLARYAPVPGWGSRSAGLGAALDEVRADAAVKVVVAPPFSGLVEPLELLAKNRGWRIIEPPRDLLMSPRDAASWWQEQSAETPWVIPNLARFWLRHRSGLALVREVLTRVACNDQGEGVIGCSSWCWEFWVRYMPELAISPHTLAPLDGELLARWFAALPQGRLAHPLSVRMAHNGHWALLPEGADDDSDKRSSFLKDLAAKARGNSGVALAIWRVALQARPEQESEDEAPEGKTETTALETCDCWVLPLEQIRLPAMPGSSTKKLTQILHSMLLHTRLSEQRLALTTGLSEYDVGVCLSTLKRAELVVRNDAGWSVTVLGYPAIRQHLQSDGYPMDRF